MCSVLFIEGSNDCVLVVVLEIYCIISLVCANLPVPVVILQKEHTSLRGCIQLAAKSVFLAAVINNNK